MKRTGAAIEGGDSELNKRFEACTMCIWFCLLRLWTKGVMYEIFHTKVNKYMVASEDIELRGAGKMVKVEQCLRDNLKTFSALKSFTQ